VRVLKQPGYRAAFRPVRRVRPIERLESRTLLSIAEPNNTLPAAFVVDGNGGFAGKATFSDTINAGDPVDIFRINAPNTFTDNFAARLYNLSGDLTLTLIHDLNGNGVEDPGEVSVSSAHGGTTEESLTRGLVPQTGVYYLKVTSAAPGGSSSYSLDIVLDSAGDTPANARSIISDGAHSISEGLNNTNDLYDIYHFYFGLFVGETGTVAVRLVAPTSTNYHVDLFHDVNNNEVFDPGELLTTSRPGDGDQEIAPRTLTVTSNTNSYYLRVLHSAQATENYTLSTLFDFAGNTLATARNAGGNQDYLSTYTDEVGDTPGISFFDKDDFYRFTETNPVTLYAELDLNADSPPSAHQATFQLIHDANGNNKIDAGETLATATTNSSGKAFIKRALSPSNKYYIHVTGSPFPNYTLIMNGDTVPGVTAAAPQTTNSENLGTLDRQFQLDGALGAGDSTDTYKFVLPLAGRLSGTFYNFAGNTHGIVEISRDSNNNGKIDANELLQTFNNATPLVKKSFAAGTYFMTVAKATTHEYEIFLTPDFAGDTPQTARSVGTLGAFTKVSDGVGASNPADVDYYKFSLGSSQTFTATLDLNSGISNNVTTTLTLYKDNGGGSLTQLQTASFPRQFGLLQRSLSTGNYQVKVSTTNYFYNYSLGFSTGDNDDAMGEVLLSQHNQAEVGTTFPYEGDFTLSDASDVDLLAVYVNNGATIAFDTGSRDGSSVNTYLRLFDSKGNQVASNDDGAAPGEPASKLSYLKFTVPATSDGIYFLGVSSSANKNYSPSTGGGDAGGSSTGAYHLSIRDITGLSGSIAGSVFNDANGNGKLDTGELGSSGRSVYIDLDNDSKLDANEFRVTTTGSGQYTLPNLGAGTYKVRQVLPSGWSQTSPTSNAAISVTLSSGQKVTGKNFFARQTNASIAGNVFHDFNRNGSKDTGDSGLSAWVVYIDSDNDKVLDASERRVTTDASGNYLLGSLAAGTYRVRAMLKSGWVQTSPAGGFAQNVTLAAGQKVSGKNFGVDN
jgi:hypothetical protein